MITDRDTNFVYISRCLKRKRYSVFLKRFERKLKAHGIRYDFLQLTNDIWCRDYMPVQTAQNKFTQFKYDPVYPPWTDATKVCKDIGIESKVSDIKVDGGNVVRSRTKAIMTKRVIKKNKRRYAERELKTRLKKLLSVKELIIIPECPDDPFGHADGMARFRDGVKDEREVFVNDYGREEAELKEEVYRALEKRGLTPIPMPYDPAGKGLDARGIYINYLQVGKVVFYPTYGFSSSDKKAGSFFSKYFGANAVPIRADKIAKEGGILNCISWNILQRERK